MAVVLIFQSNCTFGQYDWKQGYLINNNGDTLHGYIDDRILTSNQKICYFKSSQDGKTEMYKPNEIKEYRFIYGNIFISKSIEIFGVEDTIFLELLIGGKANIYRFSDTKTRFFIEIDGKLTELINTETVVSINNIQYYKEKKEYVGILALLLQDADIYKEIQRTDFKRESLIRIVKIYNKKMCSDEEGNDFERKSYDTNFDFGLTFGRNIKTFEVADIYGETGLRNKGSNYGGITFCISEFRGLKRFSFAAEALIGNYYFENKLRTYALIPLLVGYKFSLGNNYPQIEAGITNSLMEPGMYVAPMAGIGFYFTNKKKQGVYVKVRAEDIPTFVRIGAGIYF